MPNAADTDVVTEDLESDSVDQDQEVIEDVEGADSDSDDDGSDDGDETEIPDWVKAKLTKANGQAANYRTQLRDAQAKLAAAKSVEEFEAATADLNTKIEALEKAAAITKAASKFKLPTELSELLKGDTDEELEAHAKILAKFATPGSGRAPSGGVRPDQEGDDLPDDPRELAKRARSAR